ncbi:MAG TPA: hypothetical protein VFN52_02050, partial [Acidiferrobacteraceae bacterium]|nr:hypothetical protein [Acidiferrobacteraceae bacterium]
RLTPVVDRVTALAPHRFTTTRGVKHGDKKEGCEEGGNDQKGSAQEIHDQEGGHEEEGGPQEEGRCQEKGRNQKESR